MTEVVGGYGEFKTFSTSQGLLYERHINSGIADEGIQGFAAFPKGFHKLPNADEIGKIDLREGVVFRGDTQLFGRAFCLGEIATGHEVGQREIKRGVEPADAYARPDAYQLTQALGPRNSKFVKPDINFFDLNEDTLLLLCSDGLSDGNFLENHSQTHLVPLISSKANLEQGLIELIDRANQQSGHDNITGLIARVKVRPNTDQPMPARATCGTILGIGNKSAFLWFGKLKARETPFFCCQHLVRFRVAQRWENSRDDYPPDTLHFPWTGWGLDNPIALP